MDSTKDFLRMTQIHVEDTKSPRTQPKRVNENRKNEGEDPKVAALKGFLHHVEGTKDEYLPPKSLIAHVKRGLEQGGAEVDKALKGIVHHDKGVKADYQLPKSLMRQVSAALGESKRPLPKNEGWEFGIPPSQSQRIDDVGEWPPPDNALAWKWADPTEDARWLTTEEEIDAVEREDPSLVLRLSRRNYESKKHTPTHKGPVVERRMRRKKNEQ